MTLARWQRTIVDNAGNVLPEAQVTVRREVAGGPLAVLYADREGTTPAGNPLTADGNGFVAFHVAGGAFRIDVASGAFSQQLRYVPIGLQQESDAVLLDISYLFSVETTDSDPGAGAFAFDNATLASVTKIYFSELDDVGADLTDWLTRLDDYGVSSDRGTIAIRSLDGLAEFIGRVTGSIVDGTDYRKVSVTHLASAGAFASGQRVGVHFTATGPVVAGVNAQTGTSYGLVLADAAKIVTMNNASPNDILIPTNANQAFPLDTIINVVRLGPSREHAHAPCGGDGT
jgi:hypothetical protein